MGYSLRLTGAGGSRRAWAEGGNVLSTLFLLEMP
jgi:hypothetical protein